MLSAQTIMGLYRCRWQVEIAIKRWKSVLDVDALRAKATSPLAEVWLHGKSATSGKAGGLKKIEPLKADRSCEPLKAVRL